MLGIIEMALDDAGFRINIYDSDGNLRREVDSWRMGRNL
jgi:hypothetical protein